MQGRAQEVFSGSCFLRGSRLRGFMFAALARGTRSNGTQVSPQFENANLSFLTKITQQDVCLLPLLQPGKTRNSPNRATGQDRQPGHPNRGIPPKPPARPPKAVPGGGRTIHPSTQPGQPGNGVNLARLDQPGPLVSEHPVSITFGCCGLVRNGGFKRKSGPLAAPVVRPQTFPRSI